MIHVFYDEHCGLCTRTMRLLKRLDWFGILRPVDFHNPEERRREAPSIPFEQLDRVIHMRMPDGSFQTGFSAFRRLCWHLPPLWIAAPFLYLPGAKLIGDSVYARIAENRKKCTHASCR